MEPVILLRLAERSSISKDDLSVRPDLLRPWQLLSRSGMGQCQVVVVVMGGGGGGGGGIATEVHCENKKVGEEGGGGRENNNKKPN